jgi:hypothetical protein
MTGLREPKQKKRRFSPPHTTRKEWYNHPKQEVLVAATTVTPPGNTFTTMHAPLNSQYTEEMGSAGAAEP